MSLRFSSIRMDRCSPERLDQLIEVLLLILLAFSPLAFGVVHAWSEEIVLILAAALSLTFLLKLVLFPATSLVWTWAYIPVILFLLIAVVQLLPLPGALVTAVAPQTGALKTELLRDLPDAEEVLARMTLSFYPRATRHDLRLVLAVAAVFVVVLNVYREPARVKRLLRALAVIGGGVAVLALAQDAAGNGKIYWSVPTYDRASSGPFINHSHYGQFMNLSLGAALGLLLVMLQEAFAGRRVSPQRVAHYLRSHSGKIVKLLLAMIVLGTATIFLSLSRGAMISMLIAAAFTTLVLSARRSLQGRGWIIMLVALGAFICILYIGFEGVYSRLATLRDLGEASSGRWQIVKDIALAWTKFPLFGVGLGTHAVVYPMFDRSTIPALAMYAENEYAQAAEETGFLGLLTLAVFGVIVAVCYVRSARTTSVPIHAAACGLGFGLMAVLIHSLSDFGQHLPANALLSATCCALLIALAHLRPGADPQRLRPAAGPVRRALRLAALPFLVGIFAWALWGGDRARVAEEHWKSVLAAEQRLEADMWQGSDQTLTYLFSHAQAAAEAEPDNIQYRHWLGVYKWLSLTPYVDPNTGQLLPPALAWAREIATELHQVRPLCPTFGPTCCVVGEIEMFVLGDPNGAERIRQGYRLAPCDTTTCLAAARVDIETGANEDAFAKITRAVHLDRGCFRQAAVLCVEKMNRADLALLLAGDDVQKLSHLANVLSAAGGQDELVETARARALELLEKKSREPGAPAQVFVSLAGLYSQRGDVERGIERYRLALKKNYQQASVHLELAKLLKQTGRTGEALHEAQVCLRLSPNLWAAKKLVNELVVLPDESSPPERTGQ
jgi:tetratricopeptide (TPR) repeat protein